MPRLVKRFSQAHETAACDHTGVPQEHTCCENQRLSRFCTRFIEWRISAALCASLLCLKSLRLVLDETTNVLLNKCLPVLPFEKISVRLFEGDVIGTICEVYASLLHIEKTAKTELVLHLKNHIFILYIHTKTSCDSETQIPKLRNLFTSNYFPHFHIYKVLKHSVDLSTTITIERNIVSAAA